MKKAVSLLFVVIFFLSSAALADTFTFSNGVRWGMSQDEVRKCDPSYFSERQYHDGVHYLRVTGAPISKYEAIKEYDFAGDDLFMVMYELNLYNSEVSDYEYLQNALTYVYGNPQKLSGDTVLKYMGAVMNLDFQGSNYMEFSHAHQWTVNNTNIWLFRGGFDDQYQIILMYTDKNYNVNKIPQYDIRGL